MSFREFLFGKKEPPAGKIAKAAQWRESAQVETETEGNLLKNRLGPEPEDELEDRLIKWLDKVLEQEIPEDVRALCFNLYDEGNGGWSLELVGTKQFDLKDEDWACDEVTDFGTREEPFRWEKTAEWEEILEEIKGVIWYYLADEDAGKYPAKLTDREAVGVGFVEGNIELVYLK